MPSWIEFAAKVAHDYVDCCRRAKAADEAGDMSEASSFRKLAARYKRMMDNNGITVCA